MNSASHALRAPVGTDQRKGCTDQPRTDLYGPCAAPPGKGPAAAWFNGSVPDALNTSGSEHHSIISVFKRPGFSPPPTSGGGRLSAGRRAAVVR